MGPLNITFCLSVRTPGNIQTVEFETFEEFCASFSPPVTYADTNSKDKPSDLPLLIPVSEWSEHYRKDENVRKMSRVFVADFDRISKQKRAEIEQRLDGYSYLLATSWNHQTEHKDNLECFRIILELDREYDVSEFSNLFTRMQTFFGGAVDKTTEKPSLGYFVPCIRQGHESSFELHTHSGKAFSLAQIEKTAPESASESSEAPEKADVPPPYFASMVRSWSAYRGQEPALVQRKTFGKDITAILAGKPPLSVTPGQGERHEWMVKLAGTLALNFYSYSPESLMKCLDTEGWKAFCDGDDRAHGLPRLKRMVEDFQGKEVEKRAKLKKERESAERELILQATAGARDKPLDKKEIEALEEIHGKFWRRHAVLQSKGAYFFMDINGDYGTKAWDRNELVVAARDRFAVFGDEVSITYEHDGKIKLHTLGSFMQKYGTALSEVWYDQRLQKSKFDPSTKTLAIACAKHRVPAEFSQEVQDWLNFMGGELLLDMTAGMTRLSEQLPVLVLTGPGGSGKTLYADAVGHIFGMAPLEPKDTFSQFNAQSMIKQPITLHDEKAGEEYQKQGTTLVRKFVTQSERWVEEKYLPKMLLKGHPRLIFCANNHHILDTQEDMSADDREAFAERIVHIDLTQEHVDYCKKNLARTKRWIEEGTLSKHFLWLGQNHEIKNLGDRFVVKGPRTKLHESIAGGAGTAAEVVQWLLCYLADPGQIDATGKEAIKVIPEKNELRASAYTIYSNWETYLEGRQVPRLNVVERALASISHEKRVKIPLKSSEGAKKVLYGRSVQIDILRSRLSRHHMGHEEFDQVMGLSSDTPPTNPPEFKLEVVA